MDGKLVTDLPPRSEGSGREERSAPFSSYAEVFEKEFPYYLSIGMTCEQYWNGPSDLVKAYREAEKIRRNRKNEELWLQGMYVYEAICDASPILHAFAKSGTRPIKYPEQPYAIDKKSIEDREEEKERKEMENGKKYMDMFARNFNKKRKEGSE